MVVYPSKHRVWMRSKLVVAWSICIRLNSFSCSLESFSFLRKICDEHDFDGHEFSAGSGNCLGMYTLRIYISLVEKAVQGFCSRKCLRFTATDKNYERKKNVTTVILIACNAFACVVPAVIFYYFIAR